MKLPILALVVILPSCSLYAADNPYNTPMAFDNMKSNVVNSDQWSSNSNQNFNNLPSNPYSTTRVYSESGRSVGYGVSKSTGGVNYFNNAGDRRGYSSE